MSGRDEGLGEGGDLRLFMTSYQLFVFQSRSVCNTKSTGGLGLCVRDIRYLLVLEDNSKGLCSRQGTN